MAARENEADRRPLAAPSGSVNLTASNSIVLQPYCHKLFLGNVQSGSNIVLRMLDGSTPTLTFGQASYVVIDLEFDGVQSTGTSSFSSMVGFYHL